MWLLLKNLLIEMRKTRMRFLSIFSICALGVAFFVGIRATSPDMKDAGDSYFNAYGLSDLNVMSTSGLTGADIEALRGIEGVEAVAPGLFADAMMTGGFDAEPNIRLISMPIVEKHKYGTLLDLFPSYDIDPEPDYFMNRLEIESGRLPISDQEVALDTLILTGMGVSLGDHVTFTTAGGSVTLRVVGFVHSPKYVSLFERGSSTVGNGSCDGFAYASGNAIGKLGTKLPIIGLLSTIYTQAEITVSGKERLSAFSDEYKRLVGDVADRIEDYAEGVSGTWYVQTRSANPGYSDYSENTDRIAAVGDVFPIIFFIVAALVSLTTMTRMVEEQRIEMGTFKALGYSTASIVGKYFAYAMTACVSGGFFGAVIGFKLFPTVIITAYSIMYRIPGYTTPYRHDIAAVAIVVVALCTGAATLSASWAALMEVPSTLMRPKAPKAGKRVFLEKIGFIWSRLGFTTKVTVRNIFRYKKRFFMSVLGISGSCALLVTAFGLQDSIFGIADIQFGEIWKMDVQAYSYESMDMAEMEGLIADNAASEYFDSYMLCNDSTNDAGIASSDVKAGSVHVLGVDSATSLEGKISLRYEGRPVTLADDGVIITEKLAEIFSLGPGDTLIIYNGTVSHEVAVTGIAENYVYNYVYMTSAYYERVFGEPMKYNCFMANLTGGLGDGVLEEISVDVLADQRMYTVMTLGSIYDTVTDSLKILDYVVLLLIVGSALLSFVVMLNLTNINIGERKRELATLRVLGFYDKEMYSYIFRENNALAVIGAAVGLVFGKYMHAFVIKTCEVDLVRFVRHAEPLSFVYSFGMTVLFSLAVNFIMRRKVRSVDMVVSLKSAE